MKLQKALSILGLMLALTIKLPVVHADDWNQTTRFTFSQPVQIPGRVLPPGTYRFQLADNDDRHLVQIFREDRTLVATLYSIPRLRDERSADAAITLANRGAGPASGDRGLVLCRCRTRPRALVFETGKSRTCACHSNNFYDWKVAPRISDHDSSAAPQRYWLALGIDGRPFSGNQEAP